MKNIILVVVFICCLNIIASAQVDSNKLVYDSILFNKSKYIGQKLNTLFNDIDIQIDFSDPPGSRKRGIVYYKSISIYLPVQSGKPLYSFWVKLGNKVTVNREEIIAWRRNGTASRKLKALLKNQIVTDLKF